MQIQLYRVNSNRKYDAIEYDVYPSEQTEPDSRETVSTDRSLEPRGVVA